MPLHPISLAAASVPGSAGSMFKSTQNKKHSRCWICVAAASSWSHAGALFAGATICRVRSWMSAWVFLLLGGMDSIVFGPIRWCVWSFRLSSPLRLPHLKFFFLPVDLASHQALSLGQWLGCCSCAAALLPDATLQTCGQGWRE